MVSHTENWSLGEYGGWPSGRRPTSVVPSGGPTGVRITPRSRTSRKETYTKARVPARYSSVFFQNALLDDSRVFTLPPPRVSCSEICQTKLIILFGRGDTVYPGRILRPRDITDGRGIATFEQKVSGGSCAYCQSYVLGVHLEG